MGQIPLSPTVQPGPQSGAMARESTAPDFGSSPWSADFRARFEKDAAFVRGVLRHLGVPQADRDDLVQEVFFVVCRKLPGYDGRAPFRSWLYGICLRTVSSYRRSARVRHQSGEYCAVDDCESDIGFNPELNAELRRICDALETLLLRLDDDKRKVFVLFALEGLPMTEVARIVGCPLQTAYSRLHAARKALRGLL
jgi:RNA polymerase sigma-70 factor (ECF subfamily)